MLTEGGTDIHMRDEEGATPLHLAAEFGRADYAQLLLERGADVNAKDREGATPLHWAVAGKGASRDFDARAGSEKAAKQSGSDEVAARGGRGSGRSDRRWRHPTRGRSPSGGSLAR